MKDRILGFLLLFVLAGCAGAQEMDNVKAASDWQAMNAPGEAHKVLGAFAGDWTTTTKTWMGGPGQAPLVTNGTSEIRWILGGRFLEEKALGQFTMPAHDGKQMSMEYEGRGLMGHDNVRNQYVTTWTDNLTTQITYATGSWDADKKVMTMYATLDEPVLGVYGRWIRLKVTVEGPDSHLFEMFDLNQGEHKFMEIHYQRKK